MRPWEGSYGDTRTWTWSPTITLIRYFFIRPERRPLTMTSSSHWTSMIPGPRTRVIFPSNWIKSFRLKTPFVSFFPGSSGEKWKVKSKKKSEDAYFLKASPLKAISNTIIYPHSISKVKENASNSGYQLSPVFKRASDRQELPGHLPRAAAFCARFSLIFTDRVGAMLAQRAVTAIGAHPEGIEQGL